MEAGFNMARIEIVAPESNGEADFSGFTKKITVGL